jgi:hypothetical protein
VSLGSGTLVASGSIPGAGEEELILIANDGADAVAGTFNKLPEGATVTINGIDFTIPYMGGDGNDVVLIGNPDNNGPVLHSTGGPYTLSEGQDLLLSATVSDSDADQTLTVTWNIDNDGGRGRLDHLQDKCDLVL